MEELRFRQIQLDFHTSEKIPSVGAQFDAEEFAKTLEEARVNSVTCFARCHHGMLYYPSRRFPELIHPGLKKKDLLIRQIDACHRHGIRVPIYLPVQWDYHMSQNHLDWCCMTPDGGIVEASGKNTSHVYEASFLRTLCVNSPEYRQFLKDQIADLFDVLGAERVDGFFLDIVNVVDCSCHNCVAGMLREGYDPERKEERVAYATKLLDDFRREMSAFIGGLKSNVTIFYNDGDVGYALTRVRKAYTHCELESLPSGGWGYTHFPNNIRYVRTSGIDYVAHTGKFHTSWGDFHSFKNKEALQYECFRMLAYNSKCLIGDQLEPDGAISKPAYELIGSVYREVEKKEPWCSRAKAVAEIAVLNDRWQKVLPQCEAEISPAVSGACAMLDEMAYQLDIVDDKTDWSRYKVLVVPDVIWFDEALAEKAEAYLAGGGKMILTGKSGLDQNRTRFMLSSLGLAYVGEAPYSPDFLMPGDVIGKTLPKTEHVMYQQGQQVEAVEAEVLADAYIPYFNRTWRHFCSHQHTPSAHRKGYPAVTRNGDCIYFMHPIFSIYRESHPRWCREVFRDALELLLPQPLIRHDGPTTMTVTLNEQERQKRYILHVLHYIPTKNCEEMYTIEDVIPLYRVHFSVKPERPVKSLQLVPEGIPIAFEERDGRIEFEVPKIEGHAMVELGY